MPKNHARNFPAAELLSRSRAAEIVRAIAHREVAA